MLRLFFTLGLIQVVLFMSAKAQDSEDHEMCMGWADYCDDSEIKELCPNMCKEQPLDESNEDSGEEGIADEDAEENEAEDETSEGDDEAPAESNGESGEEGTADEEAEENEAEDEATAEEDDEAPESVNDVQDPEEKPSRGLFLQVIQNVH